MERIQEEMVKMSQDERDRYLYLREAMAASDRVSQMYMERIQEEIYNLINNE